MFFNMFFEKKNSFSLQQVNKANKIPNTYRTNPHPKVPKGCFFGVSSFKRALQSRPCCPATSPLGPAPGVGGAPALRPALSGGPGGSGGGGELCVQTVQTAGGFFLGGHLSDGVKESKSQRGIEKVVFFVFFVGRPF